MPTLLAAIAVGASAGAIFRWALSGWLNALYPPLPLGTLAANLIGVALAVFADGSGLSPVWRLLFVTGFLGGLTTFSTFSAEVVSALLEGRTFHALATVTAHVLGSLALTALGIATVRWFSGSFTAGG